MMARRILHDCSSGGFDGLFFLNTLKFYSDRFFHFLLGLVF